VQGLCKTEGNREEGRFSVKKVYLRASIRERSVFNLKEDCDDPYRDPCTNEHAACGLYRLNRLIAAPAA
jgi:hypothetical protein